MWELADCLEAVVHADATEPEVFISVVRFLLMFICFYWLFCFLRVFLWESADCLEVVANADATEPEVEAEVEAVAEVEADGSVSCRPAAGQSIFGQSNPMNEFNKNKEMGKTN